MTARCLRCGAGNEWIEGKATHTAAPIPEGMVLALKNAETCIASLDRTYARVWERDRNDGQPGYVSGNINVNVVGELIHCVRAMLAAYKEQP